MKKYMVCLLLSTSLIGCSYSSDRGITQRSDYSKDIDWLCFTNTKFSETTSYISIGLGIEQDPNDKMDWGVTYADAIMGHFDYGTGVNIYVTKQSGNDNHVKKERIHEGVYLSVKSEDGINEKWIDYYDLNHNSQNLYRSIINSCKTKGSDSSSLNGEIEKLLLSIVYDQ